MCKIKNNCIKYTNECIIINMINSSKNDDKFDVKYCTKVNKKIFLFLYVIFNLK